MNWEKIEEKYDVQDLQQAAALSDSQKAAQYVFDLLLEAKNHLEILQRMDQELVLAHTLHRDGTTDRASWLTLSPHGQIRYRYPHGTDSASQAYKRSSHLGREIALSDFENIFKSFGLTLAQVKDIEAREQSRLEKKYPEHFMAYHLKN